MACPAALSSTCRFVRWKRADSDLGLELSNLLAERWLGDLQSLGGSAEVKVLGDGEEVAQMAELDIHMQNLSIERYKDIGHA